MRGHAHIDPTSTSRNAGRPMRESQLQDAIWLALGRIDGLVLWPNPCGQGLVGKPERSRHVKYGVGNPGGADMIGCYRGRFLAVEIKTPIGRQSEEQKRFAQLVRDKGGEYVVLRSVDDALTWAADLAARYPTTEAHHG